MPAIVGTDLSAADAIAVTETTLTASDTITYNENRRPVLVLRNTTGAQVDVTIDGDGGSSVNVGGIGAVDVSAGKTISVPANAVEAVRLSSIEAYLRGTIAVTGGVGVVATLLEF